MLITLLNFMSHNSTVLELPDRGLVKITGPNGAGKSAIVEAFSVAIWGRGARSTRWQPWRPDEEGLVQIEDSNLVVTRQRTASGKKKLQWRTPGEAEQEHDTNTKGQEGLDQVVGSFEAWRRTCVFSSADAAHFTLATDAERKELLEELLGLGWFDRALQACRKDLHSARTALGQGERERDVCAARAEEVGRLAQQASLLLQETPDPGDVGTLRADLVRVNQYISDAALDRRSCDADRRSLLEAGGESMARARELKARLDRLTGDECFTCGQEIPQVLRHNLETMIDAQVKEAAAARAANLDAVKKLETQLEELDEEVSSLRDQQQGYQSKLDSIVKARDMRSRLEAQAKRAADQVLSLQEQVNDSLAAIAESKVDVAELEACERVLGVRGARAHLIGQTLSSIEALTNSWLTRLGSEISIQLKPYTEKKSGGTVDSISLQLSGAGGEGGYLGASAGERRRVDVAVLLALAELSDGAAQGRRWRSPVFFDEVFDGLDEDGRGAVMELVSSIAEDRLVVLITHNEGLAAGRADLRLRVDGGRIT